MPPSLEVRGLLTVFRTGAGIVRAVDRISVEAGETVAVVSESAPGKSVGTQSMLCLRPDPPDPIVAGETPLDDREMRSLPGVEKRHARSRDICTAFQEPMTSLDPALAGRARPCLGLLPQRTACGRHRTRCPVPSIRLPAARFMRCPMAFVGCTGTRSHPERIEGWPLGRSQRGALAR